jgi:hypothetical protein
MKTEKRWISFLIYVALTPIVLLQMVLRTVLYNILMVLGLIVAGLGYIPSLIFCKRSQQKQSVSPKSKKVEIRK